MADAASQTVLNKQLIVMAKSQHTFMKRQREIQKKKKAAEKREKREEKKNNPTEGSGPEIATYVVNHGMVIGAVGDQGLAPRKPESQHVKKVEDVKEEISKEGGEG